ncbi:4'-phosphopantetheinyl transferase superfamily [Phlebopus sp. FC_14]|nr:4'-phosphopantetheinyl transferase superfamily [Phlebopus sp. FC_14]
MSVHGIGVDLLHVPRLVALIKRRGSVKLASRILSPREQQAFHALELHSSREKQPRLDTLTRFLGVRYAFLVVGSCPVMYHLFPCLARWAVKEAAYKALYPFRPTWKELTYTTFDSQNGTKPTLAFDPRSTLGMGPWALHVSVSHDGDYIFASVFAETRT